MGQHGHMLLSKNAMSFRDEKRIRFFLNLRPNCLPDLIGILTGHSKLNHYLNRIKVKLNPKYELCLMEEEMITHFLCSRLLCLRSNLLMEVVMCDL